MVKDRLQGGLMDPLFQEDVKDITWIIIGGLAILGGLVRYIIDSQQRGNQWCWIGASSQIVVSGFTGLLGGLLSIEINSEPYFTYAIAGLSGTLGSTALSYFWQRFLFSDKLPLD